MTPCSTDPPSTAQLRWMRVVARREHIDVGPACCGAHAQEFIRDHGGLDEVVATGSYL